MCGYKVYVCVYLYVCNRYVYRCTHICEYILCVRALVRVFLSALSLALRFA